jgi:hypothetical protein
VVFGHASVGFDQDQSGRAGAEAASGVPHNTIFMESVPGRLEGALRDRRPPASPNL